MARGSLKKLPLPLKYNAKSIEYHLAAMNQTIPQSEPKILIIRRDNIGDLVCTTPLFSALRQHYPNAHLAARVNSYYAEVLEGTLILTGTYP